jgi:DNA repair exonuclease SbcCD ATPase subunit
MLPVLQLLEFSKILPLSENSIETVTIKNGVNKFLAENGSGKTTLTDLIEHSLVRDAHAFAWNVFSKKRVDKNAYVRSKWAFGDRKSTIVHEFTDAGARSRISSPKFSEKAVTREDYSNFLYEQTNLELQQLQRLFEGIYYKRENDLNLLGTAGEDDLMEFFELLNKTIRVETPDTIKLRNQIGHLRMELKTRRNKKKNMENKLEKLELLFEGANSSAEALETIGSRKAELQISRRRLEEQIIALDDKIEELHNEEDQAFERSTGYDEELVRIRNKIDELKSKRFSIKNQLQRRENELEGFKKLQNINYQEIKEKWEGKENCELCGAAIYTNWGERIQEGCPVCGTEWRKLPDTAKEALGVEQKSLGSETSNLQQEVDNLTHQLRSINEDIEKARKEEEEILQNTKTLREQLRIINSRQRKIQEEKKELNRKIQRLGEELGQLTAQEKMVNQNENVNLLKMNLEKVSNQIKEYEAKKERLEKELPEQEELQKILNNFAHTTKELFGYSMLADTETRTITISKDGSVRDFAAMSWSERFFIDIVLRMAIFHFLIDNKVINQGMIILDSPEAALDPHRLELLATLINKHKDRINFIVATRVGKFYDQLEGYDLEIKKQIQTSLFDFLEAS